MAKTRNEIAKTYRDSHPEELKAREEKRRAANPDKELARRKEWYYANKERALKKQAEWQAANPANVLQHAKNWRDKNPEQHKAISRNWAAKNMPSLLMRNKVRKANQIEATPKWANKFFMEEIYDLAMRRTKSTGFTWNVDHIVPVNSPKVCGLHCEFNLQVIPESQNKSKGNRYWPDMPEVIHG